MIRSCRVNPSEVSVELRQNAAAVDESGCVSRAAVRDPISQSAGTHVPHRTQPDTTAQSARRGRALASGNDWSFERASDDEITILINGRWTDYQVSFTWMDDIEALHLACAFDLKVPERRRAEVQQLIAQVNEQMWVGHFDLWPKDGMVMFRHALVLAGGVEASGEQCEAVLATALEACERYFPAFQFVVWAGKPAREALDAAMFETSGEA